MNIPFLSKKIKWYMAELNETELKKGFFRPDQKFCTDDTNRSNIRVENLNVSRSEERRVGEECRCRGGPAQ